VQPLSIDVVLKENVNGERRYRGFFGDKIARVCQTGLEGFVTQ